MARDIILLFNFLLHLLVPVLLWYSVEAVEHDGDDDVRVLLNETDNVLVVPEVKCTLSNLKASTHTHIKYMYSSLHDQYVIVILYSN